MKALLLTTNSKQEKICLALAEAGVKEVVYVCSGQEAREALHEGLYALALLLDGSAELAKELAACSSAGILLPILQEQFEERSPELTRAGVFTLSKPLSRAILVDSARHAAALFYRLNGAAAENEKLLNKLNEAKMVNRAKLALIKYLNMSEAQAHRYIEKQAMDRQTTRLNVAMSILTNYGV